MRQSANFELKSLKGHTDAYILLQNSKMKAYNEKLKRNGEQKETKKYKIKKLNYD